MVKSVGVRGPAFALLFCGSELARDGGLPADRNLSDVLSTCGSELARDGGQTADRNHSDVLSTCRSQPELVK
ncbi:hypothetical protein D3C71_1930010 [compost metagenome]